MPDRAGAAQGHPARGTPDREDQEWQRLDKWLWCARFMRARSDCAVMAAQGRIRINRQVTEKAHARLRVGDVLTVPVGRVVRVVRVLGLGQRRGPAPEARLLYEDMSQADSPSDGAEPAWAMAAPTADQLGGSTVPPIPADTPSGSSGQSPSGPLAGATPCACGQTSAYRPV